LDLLDAIEEISIVVAPGIATDQQKAIQDYCELGANSGNFYRFAIFDCQQTDSEPTIPLKEPQVPEDTDYAAFYYPWIKVADPATKIMDPSGDDCLQCLPVVILPGFMPLWITYEAFIKLLPMK
jgi:hypothetical protein